MLGMGEIFANPREEKEQLILRLKNELGDDQVKSLTNSLIEPTVESYIEQFDRVITSRWENIGQAEEKIQGNST